MKEDRDELRREIAVLRDRSSRLCAAVLRINASLDVTTVLHEVVASARALTGARYGVITTIGDAGQAQEAVFSGFTPEEQESVTRWPGGVQLFEHFRDLPGVLRLADLSTYARSLGVTPTPMWSTAFQATPMRHRGAYVGSFFLGTKEGGGEFTSGDEEVLVLLASQAATAIANARTHRDERRARADLETLIETSPVGVVVFDGTGRPKSSNREARRIVEVLRGPDRSIEQLLEVVTCRRADGRMVSLAEIPLGQQWSANGTETLRAEEVTLSVPDGRSVTTLVNVTPIRSTDGEIESVVVTLQDLAPLDELERQRAEFLSLVSHELRAPLISIKGSTATVLGAAPVPDPAEMLQFFRVIDDQADHMRGLIGDLLDQGRIETGTLSVSPEPTEVAGLVDRARSTFLTGGGRHALRIDLPEELPPVMADRGRLVQVLNNLFSNAAEHSPESFPIRIAAALDGVHVVVSVTDGGPGLPPDLLPHLFRKHAGAAGGAREPGVRGHGLGLAICRGLVEAHGGRIWAESGGAGRGARFCFTVPVAEEAAYGAAADRGPTPARPTRDAQGKAPVLVVDDDPQMLRYVRLALTEAGYVPIVTGDPEELPGLIRTHQPRLVLLDLLLPGADGIELLERTPELGDLPVIFISAYGREETVVRALDAGAADYIVKPFSSSELTARVRAALRRRAEPEPFCLGELAIHYEQRRVTVGGRPVELTATEFDLLRVLSVSAGRVVTYESLLRQAWGRRNRGAADPKLVRAMVKTLRRKLGDDAVRPAYVLNQRGVGYRMPEPGDDRASAPQNGADASSA